MAKLLWSSLWFVTGGLSGRDENVGLDMDRVDRALKLL